MRCLLVLIGLHAVWTMMDAQRERGHFYGIKSVTSSIKGLAGMLLGGLCCACLLFRSKDTLMYHGLAGVRAYFADKGIGVVDAGTALVVYEATGFVLMVTFWVWCWAVQPVKTGLLTPLGALFEGREGIVEGARNYYEMVVQKVGDKFGGTASRFGLDPARLTTSFAEGAVCRSLLKPLLFPLKLYVAYTFVKATRGMCPWAAAMEASAGLPLTAPA